MMFGSICFVRLGKPEYVKLMFDPKGKRIAVQGSNKKTKDSIHLNPERKCKQFGIYIHPDIHLHSLTITIQL